MVDPKMRVRVRQELHKLERDRHIKVLYAAEAGSRAWGFPSPDSDYDVRFIYVRPISSYISIASRRDVIEPRDLPDMGDIDLSGWDIIKALDLGAKSNPALLEWLRSPIIYHELGNFANELRQITAAYNVRALMNHYSSMAKTQYHRHLNGTGEQVKYKKYFYALYPIFAALTVQQSLAAGSGHPTLPSLNFITLMHGLAGLDDVRGIMPFVEDLLRMKTVTLERDDQPRAERVDAFIRDYSEITRSMAARAPDDRQPDMMQLEHLCQNTIKAYQG